MMAKRHKYFRNLKYKQKLETMYNNGANRCYPSNIEFHTHERDWSLDPSHQRWTGEQDSGIFIYWDRPNVSYKIYKKDYYAPHHGQISLKKYYKKHSNKKIRHKKELYQKGQYKKIFDLWWNLW